MGRILVVKVLVSDYSPPPLQLQTFEGIPCVFIPFIRYVLVTHSFCFSAHKEIGSRADDTSLTDLDIDIREIEVNNREKVPKPVKIKYL